MLLTPTIQIWTRPKVLPFQVDDLMEAIWKQDGEVCDRLGFFDSSFHLYGGIFRQSLLGGVIH